MNLIMAITKFELKNAFREAISCEFSSIPSDDELIDHTFSQEFEYKMQKLIKKERSLSWHLMNTFSKRVAVLAVIFTVLFTTACSFESIKEPVLRFLTKIYETFTEYTFEGRESSIILEEYFLTPPEGFHQVDYFKDDAGITITYENASSDKILFYQTITSETDISMDSEYADTEIVDIFGQEVHLYLRENISVAFWIKDTYVLKIVCHGNFDKQGIINMVQNVE